MSIPTVGDWLQGLHLQQYEPIFIENGVDELEFAKSLDENALQQMGINKIGHKCHLMKAIKKLNLPSPSEEIQIDETISTNEQKSSETLNSLIASPPITVNSLNSKAPKKSEMFKTIKNCTETMEHILQENKSKPFKQHYKLKSIFTIPAITKKVKNKTK
eukprot:13837_1